MPHHADPEPARLASQRRQRCRCSRTERWGLACVGVGVGGRAPSLAQQRRNGRFCYLRLPPAALPLKYLQPSPYFCILPPSPPPVPPLPSTNKIDSWCRVQPAQRSAGAARGCFFLLPSSLFHTPPLLCLLWFKKKKKNNNPASEQLPAEGSGGILDSAWSPLSAILCQGGIMQAGRAGGGDGWMGRARGTEAMAETDGGSR